ncbi:ribose-phosphate pyrophosphokinase [Buchnera aphidicola]|uniref:ribose-phosphate pyrophosphokinase n=1 Tax=Buchnera aphidicola TaxID=9 RepID=UPI0031B681E4
MKLFTGNSIPELAKNISKCLNIHLGKSKVSKFSDGEISVQINENIRGNDIFLIQSTCAPTNDNLMELIIIADALKRASARKITAVIPYFGYARQDRRIHSSRVPITAKVIANLLSNVGINHILTIDLHAEHIQGFFDIPIDNMFGSSILLKDILKIGLSKPIIISPDIGGIIRAREISKLLKNSDIAIIDKRRPATNVAQVMNIIGNVKNRNCILIDDMIDTSSTLYQASEELKKKGAKKIFAYATHPVFSGNAIENLKKSKIDQIIVCNTIPLSSKIKKLKNIRTLTVAPLLAEAIRRIHQEKSISEMFEKSL